jgi:RimJ/RimL family protein N-acetyltransferase
MSDELILRHVIDADLPIFFYQQVDPEANHMAAFTSRDPADWAAFSAHWQKIRANPSGMIRTIVVDGVVVGYILSYEDEGHPEVGYWIGKEYWGKGYATRALREFLAQVNTARPIYVRVAKDNASSRRVLEKCGFKIVGESKGFANARQAETEEYLLRLEE